MGDVLAEILPLAVGVAISPVPIIAVILMLFTPRARSTGPAFLVGWVLGVAIVVIAATALSSAASSSSDEDTTSTAGALLELVLGLLLLLLAARTWRSRPAPGEEAPMPKWMGAIDTFTPGRAFGLAAVLGSINPKNLMLGIAAGAAIGAASLDTTETIVAIAIYVIVASLSVAIPVIYYLVGGDGAKRRLDGWKSWLAANNAAVMAVLFLLIGVKLAASGLGALIG
jgi:hypothetical protein